MLEKPNTEFGFNLEFLNAQGPRFAASDYIIDNGLRRAVEVAILLKQPLLVTGEPGTGKTRLAEKLALDLYNQYPSEYLSQPLVFHTKTISTFTDLFYLYDALSHFHDAHLPSSYYLRNNPLHPSRYIQLQAFGQALILSDPNSAQAHLTVTEARPDGSISYKLSNEIINDESFKKHGYGARSTVVLIDEVDKAPRDFTNDLLNELDRFEFYVKEDNNRRFGKGSKNIFLILTSNSEKNLPDAFLRRCIFYHIKFPENIQLQRIVLNQLFQEFQGKEDAVSTQIHTRLNEYITTFSSTFRNSNSDKKPSTSELLSWIYFLKEFIINDKPLKAIPSDTLIASFSIISKEKSDLARLIDISKSLT